MTTVGDVLKDLLNILSQWRVIATVKPSQKLWIKGNRIEIDDPGSGLTGMIYRPIQAITRWATSNSCDTTALRIQLLTHTTRERVRALQDCTGADEYKTEISHVLKSLVEILKQSQTGLEHLVNTYGNAASAQDIAIVKDVSVPTLVQLIEKQ